MDAVLPLDAALAAEFRPVALAGEVFSGWLERCNKFTRFYNEHLIKREPEPGLLEQLDPAHKFLLRLTRMMHAQMLDPDFPDREMAGRFEAALWRLQQSWEITHNTMTDAEADAILKQSFPDEA